MMAKFSMKQSGKEVGPASIYAQAHDMNGGFIDGQKSVHYETDPNTMKADESMPGGMPARRVSMGNITFEPKSTGLETRGNGAATKGRIARGPMA
jgi:hypothetical protein